MNWKLIVLLSLFGLAMAIATVFVVPSNVEPLLWLVIFVACAWWIARGAPGKYFLHTQEVDFDMVTRSQNWYQFASTTRLQHELSKPDSTRLAAMAVLFHMRLTRPLLGIIFVMMGISVILRDQNRNVFISTGMCLVLCALFFAAQFTCKNLGESDYLSPALAAWLPVLIFGPFSLTLFDAVHT